MTANKKRRAPGWVVRRINDAIKAATMENASFGGVGPDSNKITQMIRDETRFYRETWIIGPLKQALLWADGEQQ